VYWQEMQTHLEIGNERGQGERLVQEFHSAAARRVQVVCFLKNQGLNDFEVAMALKTSEHEVKKLKREANKINLPDSIKQA
jgi:transcriptional regulator